MTPNETAGFHDTVIPPCQPRRRSLLKTFVLPAIFVLPGLAALVFAICDPIFARRSLRESVDKVVEQIIPEWNIGAVEERVAPAFFDWPGNCNIRAEFQTCRDLLGRFVSYDGGVGKIHSGKLPRRDIPLDVRRYGTFTATANYQRGSARLDLLLYEPPQSSGWKIAALEIHTDPELHDGSSKLFVTISVSATAAKAEYLVNGRRVSLQQIDGILAKVSRMGSVAIGMDYESTSAEVGVIRDAIRRHGLRAVLTRERGQATGSSVADPDGVENTADENVVEIQL